MKTRLMQGLVLLLFFDLLLLVSHQAPERTGAQGVNIVYDGNFESPIANADVVTYSQGDVFGGWVVGSGTVQLIQTGRWQAPDGGQSIDLNGNSVGSLYQDLETDPDKTYALSFFIAGNPEGDPQVKQMEVWWDSTLVDTPSFDTMGKSTGNMGWTQLGPYLVSAINSTTRLEFKSITSGCCYGPAIDAVSVTSGNTPTPILDLPFNYSGTKEEFTKLALKPPGSDPTNGGRLNSLFDHDLPNYGKDHEILSWQGIRSSYPPGPPNDPDRYCQFGTNCYAGHNGIDFQMYGSEEVWAAESGVVLDTRANPWKNDCPDVPYACIDAYGNQVWIKHGNTGYATLYGHLRQNTLKVSPGQDVSQHQPIAIWGTSGNTGGGHLHFGLYYDKNDDKFWTEDESVDPYGWSGCLGCDPWSVPSTYLWKSYIRNQKQGGSSGITISSQSDKKKVTVPPGALDSTVTIELWDISPVAEPSAQLRSSGQALWLRVLEWVTGGGNSSPVATSNNSFAQPVTVEVSYEDDQIPHLNENQLSIFRFDEVNMTWLPLATTLDTAQNKATTQTTETGRFDLQAPLLCADDTTEPDDIPFAAPTVSTNGTLASRFFDSAGDQDWIQFDSAAGQQYVIQTINLTSGVDTLAEVYDLDGVTLLSSDDNSGGGKASRIVWQAPQAATYFLRVGQGNGSANGCAASYQIRVTPLKTTSTTLQSSVNPSAIGQPVIFTATVSSASDTPTGVITFKDGSTLLGNDNLDGSGKAQLTTASLAVGSHSITAIYKGEDEFGDSTSTPLNQVVDELTIVTVENQESVIQYNGWRGLIDAGANGGTYRVSNSKNDTVTFNFTGKSVKWISMKGPEQGKAQVKIDGVDKGTFDLYSPTVQYQFTKTFKGLTNGKHKIVVKVLGVKNANAADTNVAVDGFKVGSATTQDDATTVQYTKWSGKNDANASGGTYHFAKKSGAKSSFTFTGTSVDWITAKGPTSGIAQVLIDGVDKGSFDLYSAAQEWQAAISFSGLTDEQHTIEIKPLGTKNTKSTGTSIIIDAFRGPFTAIGD